MEYKTTISFYELGSMIDQCDECELHEIARMALFKLSNKYASRGIRKEHVKFKGYHVKEGDYTNFYLNATTDDPNIDKESLKYTNGSLYAEYYEYDEYDDEVHIITGSSATADGAFSSIGNKDSSKNDSKKEDKIKDIEATSKKANDEYDRMNAALKFQQSRWFKYILSKTPIENLYSKTLYSTAILGTIGINADCCTVAFEKNNKYYVITSNGCVSCYPWDEYIYLGDLYNKSCPIIKESALIVISKEVIDIYCNTGVDYDSKCKLLYLINQKFNTRVRWQGKDLNYANIFK